jgi:hypothetical protein
VEPLFDAICSYPPAITEEELSFALDGDYEALIRSNPIRDVKACASCVARNPESCIVRWQIAFQFEQQLKSNLYRFDCPTPETMRSYVGQALTKDQQRGIESHLLHCVLCRTEVAHLRPFYTNRQAEAVDAARHWLPLRSPLVWIANQLKPQDMVAAALRGERNIVYEVHDVSIFVEVKRNTAGGWTVSGQCVSASEDWAEVLVELRGSDQQEHHIAVSDASSEFFFNHVKANLILLKVTSEQGISIILPEIDLLKNAPS